jgi:hypothetical protein
MRLRGLLGGHDPLWCITPTPSTAMTCLLGRRKRWSPANALAACVRVRTGICGQADGVAAYVLRAAATPWGRSLFLCLLASRLSASPRRIGFARARSHVEGSAAARVSSRCKQSGGRRAHRVDTRRGLTRSGFRRWGPPACRAASCSFRGATDVPRDLSCFGVTLDRASAVVGS